MLTNPAVLQATLNFGNVYRQKYYPAIWLRMAQTSICVYFLTSGFIRAMKSLHKHFILT